MKERLLKSLKVTGKVLGLSVALFLLAIVSVALLGDWSQKLFTFNPLISGFLHISIDHLAFNILGVFLLMLARANQDYTLKDLFWITFLISLIYLPIPLIGLTPPAIGISGTCMFLMTRYFLTWKRAKGIGVFLLILTLGLEASDIFTNDGIAHGVHLLGGVMGYLSLKSEVITKFIDRISPRKVILA